MRTHEVLEHLTVRDMPELTAVERAQLRHKLARDYMTAQRLLDAVAKKHAPIMYTAA